MQSIIFFCDKKILDTGTRLDENRFNVTSTSISIVFHFVYMQGNVIHTIPPLVYGHFIHLKTLSIQKIWHTLPGSSLPHSMQWKYVRKIKKKKTTVSSFIFLLFYVIGLSIPYNKHNCLQNVNNATVIVASYTMLVHYI